MSPPLEPDSPPTYQVTRLLVYEELRQLVRSDPRQSRMVEMKFFGGLAIEQIEEILQISARSVARDWKFARFWLKQELDGRHGI